MYQFQTDDADLQSALRRIAAGELDAALRRMGPGAIPAGDVHDIRKRVKKLRGLLRVLRPGFAAFRRETDVLRDAAQSLSGLRDSAVRLATFDKLATGDGIDLAPLRAVLAAEQGAAAPDTEAARAALAALRDRAAGWKLRGEDRAVLTAGLGETRRRARRAMEAAVRDPSVDAMHDWRKRVKDHWYQARLMTPVWPAILAPLADLAGVLAEDLGDHHDLAVLADHLAALPGPAHLAAIAEITTRAHAAQRVLEARAFPAGRILFAGRPDDVAALWADWWQVWRG